MADIFVTYKKEDRVLAEDVIVQLQAARFSVWWDQRLTPRESWDAVIEQELDAAKAVLVLWTPRAVLSEWVRLEATAAKDAGKLVPVKLENCILPLAFRSRQAADLTRWEGDDAYPEWQRVLGWINELIGRPDRQRPVQSVQPVEKQSPEDNLIEPVVPAKQGVPDFETKSAELSGQIAQLKNQIEEYHATEARLQKSLEEATTRLQDSLGREMLLQGELVKMRATLERNESQIAELKDAGDRLESSAARRGELEAEIESLKQRLSTPPSSSPKQPPANAKPRANAIEADGFSGIWRITIAMPSGDVRRDLYLKQLGSTLVGDMEVTGGSFATIHGGVVSGDNASWRIATARLFESEKHYSARLVDRKIEGELHTGHDRTFKFKGARL
jgi:TIR domain